MNELLMLKGTLVIMEQGFYEKDERRMELRTSPAQRTAVRVLLPDDVERLSCDPTLEPSQRPGQRCQYRCENRESFEMAMDWPSSSGSSEGSVLVLNFANPVNPGGGVRNGARAQEEDLCRKSSLLLSLESEGARPYYEYNRRLNTLLGSDAIMISPFVEVIREANGALLDDTYVCAVMTCAAPVASRKRKRLDDAAYERLLRRRIDGMLKTAAHLGYRRLVLGAWGCGAFGNDARVMSDVFYHALTELDYHGYGQGDLFDSVDFAVRCRSRNQYNLREFKRNFTQEHFYRDGETG